MPDVIAIGGLVCGLLAGVAAQFGRLCTFAAIEDALVAGDLRRARAFALAIAVAVLSTQTLAWSGLIDLARAPYSAPRIELLGLACGALVFGLGMALVGTCGFGLLVRAGSGDLRAVVAAIALGIAAFAATAGPLAGPRVAIAQAGALSLGGPGQGTLTGQISGIGWAGLAFAVALLIAAALLAFALSSARTLRKQRLVAAGALLGLAVSGGWAVTGLLGDPFDAHRLESLTFVAPIGRLLLVAMGERMSGAGFAVLSVVGVVFGSFMVAAARGELRWEAFDDQREMRRHLLGAVLMGVGGVLARGCTIGQGLSAASTLAISAPVAIVGMVLGARLGLAYLIGRPALSAPRRPWARRSG